MAIRITAVNVSKKDGTSWATVDVSALESLTLEAYELYKEANAAAAKARQDFEALFRDEAGTDGIRFGYNFGKLTFAQGDAPQQRQTKKATVSLDDFLNGQRANGRAA